MRTQEQVIKEGYRQLSEIFPVAAKGMQIDAPDIPATTVDLLLRSDNGRLVLFEVRAAPPGGELRLSDCESLLVLRDVLSGLSPEQPPVVGLLTDASVDRATRVRFAEKGMPLVTLGEDRSQTVDSLRAAFEPLAIELPELAGRGALHPADPGERLSASPALAAEVERLARYESLLNLSYLLSGALAGAALGLVAGWIASPGAVPPSQVLFLGVLLVLAALAAVLTFRMRRTTKSLVKALAFDKHAELRLRLPGGGTGGE